MHWFTLDWWEFLLGKPADEISRWTAVWCRARGHPYGVVWYNMGAEPDMHCKNCYDDLG